MSIQIFFEDIKPLNIKKTPLKLGIKHLIINELKKVGTISVILCSDNYLLEINKQYLNHDYYTDVITFNYCENNVISGDLYINVERIKENAKTFDTEFIKELYRVIFHGVLHLIGYNDKSKKEQKLMRQKEDYYLREVEFGGLGL